MRLNVIKRAFGLTKWFSKFKTKLKAVTSKINQVYLSLVYSKTLLEQLSKKQQEIEWKNNLLFEKRAEFKNLMDNFPDGILIHRDGIILYTNPELLKYLKYAQSSELLGHSIYDLLVPTEHLEQVKKRTQDPPIDGR